MISKTAAKTLCALSISFLLFQESAASSPDDGKNQAGDAHTRVIMINNEGVTALSAGKYQLAVDKFEQSLKLEPSYKIASDNLAIAYNNWALQKRDNPQEAIKLFHVAAFLDPGNPTTKENLDGIITMMALNPASFKDRVKLGDDANAHGDSIGALVEYQAALKIQRDDKIKEKLEKITLPDKWKLLQGDKSAAIVSASANPAPIKNSLSPGDVDFGPYMANAQKIIKQHWHPPRSDESKEVKVVFNVEQTGRIANIRITRSTGTSEGDMAAIEAVAKSSPLPPLPKGSPQQVDIEFTFDYNVFAAGEPGTQKKESSKQPLSTKEAIERLGWLKQADKWAPYALAAAMLALLAFLYFDQKKRRSQASDTKSDTTQG